MKKLLTATKAIASKAIVAALYESEKERATATNEAAKVERVIIGIKRYTSQHIRI